MVMNAFVPDLLTNIVILYGSPDLAATDFVKMEKPVEPAAWAVPAPKPNIVARTAGTSSTAKDMRRRELRMRFITPPSGSRLSLWRACTFYPKSGTSTRGHAG